MPTRNLIVFLFLSSFSASGQTSSSEDSLIERDWYLPDGIVAGYAGGTGMVSAGMLYRISKRTDVSFTVGYTPPKYGAIWTTNLFLSLTMLKARISPELEIGVKSGVFLNYNIGDNIYLNRPEQFPDGYYWWNSAIRCGPFLELEGVRIPAKGKWKHSLYLHCNTNDLYMAAYMYSYKAVSFSDILVLGVGFRMELKSP
jgi:hypothetical protein